MGVGNGVTAKEIQAKVARAKSGPTHEGTYRAQRHEDSFYSLIPRRFARECGLEQSDELEVFVDYDIGCVMVFPAEVVDNGE